MKLKTQWGLASFLQAVPYLLLAGAGIAWLLQHGLLLAWGVGTGILTVAGWQLLRRFQRRSTGSQPPPDVVPSKNWPPAGRAAWAGVETIAARHDLAGLPLDRPEPALSLFTEVLQTVAKQYHPLSDNAVLEIPVPHLLRMIELIATDLRTAVSERIPGSHILTINDLVRLKRLATMAPNVYRMYRIVSLVLNPATSLAREMNLYLQNKVMDASAEETKRWVLQFAIKKAGFYAIDLYSGQLVLPDVEFSPFTAPSSKTALAREQRREAAIKDEPLRILVLGQVKAGKSSLVNALFGEVRAAVDVVPRTRAVDPYLLERDGMQRALILDTAGYEETAQAVETLEQARSEIVQCDLILLTCSAQSAARDADRRLLTGVRELFQKQPDREFPPLIVALTHIDLLRPLRDWTPPYNVLHPEGLKAEQIRAAMETTAADLQVDLSQVIPVCLRSGQIYNVEEGLIPAILDMMDAAHRLRYLRCLREFKDEEYWSRLRRQATEAGRVVLRTGMHLLGETARNLDNVTRSATPAADKDVRRKTPPP